MTIITRLVRVITAVVHSVFERLEGRQLLLKQCFRDMEKALTQKEARLKRLHACCEQIQREEAEFVHEIDALEQDTGVAIQKGKDHSARGFIKRIQVLTVHREELRNDRQTLEERISQLRASLTHQQYRYQQLRLRADTYQRRTAHEQLTHTPFPMFPESRIHELSDEQIELELLQRKEALTAHEVTNDEN